MPRAKKVSNRFQFYSKENDNALPIYVEVVTLCYRYSIVIYNTYCTAVRVFRACVLEMII